MDNTPVGASVLENPILSYSDDPSDLTDESKLPSHPPNVSQKSALLDRIGTTKVYVLSETAAARVSKVRRCCVAVWS